MKNRFEKRKEKKVKVKKIDMLVVRELREFRQNQNNFLNGSCNLYPKRSGSCISCSYFDKCLHYKWERDFIHEQEGAKISSKMKKRKNNIICENDIEEECYYPCIPFNDVCSEKDICNGHCIYI